VVRPTAVRTAEGDLFTSSLRSKVVRRLPAS